MRVFKHALRGRQVRVRNKGKSASPARAAKSKDGGRVLPQVGEPVPDFTLPSTAGPVVLSQVWRDRKVVLAFYIEDQTPT